MTGPFDPTTGASASDADATSRVAVPAIPTTPVAPPPRPARDGRLRWALSLGVVALVVAATVAVATLLTGASPSASVRGYVPADSIMYGEVRLDLPGDQRRAVGEFLSKFPGFADQASLETKLDEVLDNLISGVTDGEQTYVKDIKPWFGGEIAFSSGPLPPAAALQGDSSALGSTRGLALISVKDAAAAQAWFDAAITKSGASTTTESYGGATMTVFQEDGAKAAFVLLDGKVAVAGDLISVKAVIDTKGSSVFAGQAGPKSAFAATTEDAVGFAYVSLRPLIDWSAGLGASSSDEGSIGTLSATLAKSVPEWSAYWLRVEGDALVGHAVAPKAEVHLGPADNRRSAPLDHIPGNAVVAFTANSSGATIKQMLDLYRTDPMVEPVLDQVDQALALLGGFDSALGWIGDTSIVVSEVGGAPEGGLIVAPTDQAAAERLFSSLKAFIAIGGAQQGVTATDEPYAGTTITTVDLGAIGSMFGEQGIPSPDSSTRIAYAVADGVVVIGSGPDFVKHVLDTTPATSLASNARYAALADQAGPGTGSTFVDVAAIRGLIERAAAGMVPADKLDGYNENVKPFITPLDAIFAATSVDGDLARSVIYFTVK
ncbi:MAG: DUF3352 domain-containing protein [Chloroflexi bacterium]|nr:DUF3352 domain-containing protein [Chloroflexota bacterium]